MNIKNYIIKTAVVIALFLPAFVYAQDKTTIEGTFQGADCINLAKQCPVNMTPGRIANESDFVLTTKTGEVYYIPNISKTEKSAYLRVPVRITGTRDQDVLNAMTIEIKKDGKYNKVWSKDDERHGYGVSFKR